MSAHILVVDDEPKAARLAHDYLVRDGFRVIVAGDGSSALLIARRDNPDLVILDLMLPGIDGRDVCRIRSAPPDHRRLVSARPVSSHQAGSTEPTTEELCRRIKQSSNSGGALN